MLEDTGSKLPETIEHAYFTCPILMVPTRMYLQMSGI
jgi:hypothetical protein